MTVQSTEKETTTKNPHEHDESTPLFVAVSSLPSIQEHQNYDATASSDGNVGIPPGSSIASSSLASTQAGGGTESGGFLLGGDEEMLGLLGSPNHHHPHNSRTRSRTLSNVSEIFEDAYEAMVETAEAVQEEFLHVMETPVEPVKDREEVEWEVPFVHYGQPPPKLSVLALSILVFYKVSGGPFGCEPTVRAAGPLYALLGFTIFPILWSVPEALVTAELGSRFPEPSGSVAWIEEAFGSHAGLLCGYFHWVSGATDNAIYPALFLEYLASYLYTDTRTETHESAEDWLLTNPMSRFVLCSIISIVLAYINWRGLEVVGNLSVVVAVMAMSPFVLLAVLGLPKVDPQRWLILPEPVDALLHSNEDAVAADDDVTGTLASPGLIPVLTWGGVLWRPFINNLFWNLNSFDVGTCDL
jgi:hypothetical protein